MKVKARCLFKSQQAFKGDSVFLVGTETRHSLPFGISCRLQTESVFAVPKTALLYLLLFIVRFTSSYTRTVTTPAPWWQTDLFALMPNAALKDSAPSFKHTNMRACFPQTGKHLPTVYFPSLCELALTFYSGFIVSSLSGRDMRSECKSTHNLIYPLVCSQRHQTPVRGV